MIRFCALSAVTALVLLMPAAGIAGKFASTSLLAGGISVFGLTLALCGGKIREL